MPDEKVLEGEVVSETKEEVSEVDKKITEFIEEFNALQKKYEGICMLYAVNAINENGEVGPIIKLRKLK